MNENNTCKGCYWQDTCEFSGPCEYYYRTGDDSDEAITRIVEEKCSEYYREWYEYIKDFE